MCFFPKNETRTEAPGPAPAAPLAPAEVPRVGEGRRKETMAQFGSDAPNYRVDRKAKPKPVNPSGNITM